MVGNLAERLDCAGFVVFHVEDGVQLGDLQQVVNFFGQVEQLEFAALVAHGGESADQFADARAIDIVHVSEVEQDFLLPLGQQFAHYVLQYHAAFAKSNAAAAIHDGDAVNLARTGLHAHWEASLTPSDGPWTCLTSLISVPVWEGLMCTSSMNERIRKMPRPDVFKRFSGARGSGIFSRSSPLPWSRMVITRLPPVCSNSRLTFLPGSYALPWSTALTAASRTAMAILMTSSSSKPASVAIRLAACSALSTVSSVESNV